MRSIAWIRDICMCLICGLFIMGVFVRDGKGKKKSISRLIRM